MSRTLIAQLHKEMTYRPTTVAMLYDGTIKHPSLLLVQSVHGRWGPVKGGIKPRESLAQAFYRETHEEVKIERDDMRDVVHNFTGYRMIGSERGADNKGFKYGKAYFFSAARCERGVEIILDPEEIKDFAWVSLDKVEDWLPKERPNRNLVYMEVIRNLARRIRQGG